MHIVPGLRHRQAHVALHLFPIGEDRYASTAIFWVGNNKHPEPTGACQYLHMYMPFNIPIYSNIPKSRKLLGFQSLDPGLMRPLLFEPKTEMELEPLELWNPAVGLQSWVNFYLSIYYFSLSIHLSISYSSIHQSV